MCLAQGHNAVTPVRLEPATPQSRVKHSTTALPRKYNHAFHIYVSYQINHHHHLVVIFLMGQNKFNILGRGSPKDHLSKIGFRQEHFQSISYFAMEPEFCMELNSLSNFEIGPPKDHPCESKIEF